MRMISVIMHRPMKSASSRWMPAISAMAESVYAGKICRYAYSPRHDTIKNRSSARNAVTPPFQTAKPSFFFPSTNGISTANSASEVQRAAKTKKPRSVCSQPSYSIGSRYRRRTFGESAMKIAAMPSKKSVKMQMDAREIVSMPLTAPYNAITASTTAIDHFEAAGSSVFITSVRNRDRLNVFRITKYSP